MDQPVVSFSMLFGGAVSGTLSYVNWLRPEIHRAMLEFMSQFYRPWSKPSADWVTSRANFWIVEFAYSAVSILLAVDLFLRISY